jgi:hypothetical protein
VDPWGAEDDDPLLQAVVTSTTTLISVNQILGVRINSPPFVRPRFRRATKGPPFRHCPRAVPANVRTKEEATGPRSVG